jgi:hypothetical protein
VISDESVTWGLAVKNPEACLEVAVEFETIVLKTVAAGKT